MADDPKFVESIQELIKTCRDGEKGYREAAEKAKSVDLKSRFGRISAERGRFAQELEQDLAIVGKDVKKGEGHVVGALHRAWIDVKDALGAGDHAILAWLEQGDDYAKGKYEDALKQDLPLNVVSIVRRQYETILRDHDAIKSLRDSTKAA